MRQLTSLDAQFLALEDGRTHGHVSALSLYDPQTADRPDARPRARARARERAAAPAAAVPLAARPGAVRPRPPLLGRRRQLRRRLPRPRARAPGARRPPPARRAGRADRLPAAGPLAAAVGAVPDPRTRRRVRRDADQDPPRRRRRRLRRRGDERPARPLARRRRRPPPPDDRAHPSATRASSKCSPAAWPASGASRCARSRPLPARSRTSTPSRRCARSRASGRSRPPAAGSSGMIPRTSDGGVLEGRDLTAPRTRFQQRISAHRRVAFDSISLTEVKPIKNAFGCTVNDVVLALCAGALRTWLDRARRAARRTARRDGAGLGPHARAGGHLRQPRLGDARRASRPTSPTRRAACERISETMRSAKERHRALPGVADAGRQPCSCHRRCSRAPPESTSRLMATRGFHAPVNVVDLQRPRLAAAALLRRRQAARHLPGLGGDGRRRTQHHRPQLPRHARVRDRRRPRTAPGPVAAARRHPTDALAELREAMNQSKRELINLERTRCSHHGSRPSSWSRWSNRCRRVTQPPEAARPSGAVHGITRGR